MDGTELYREHFFFRNTAVLPHEVHFYLLKMWSADVVP